MTGSGGIITLQNNGKTQDLNASDYNFNSVGQGFSRMTGATGPANRAL